MNVEPKEYTDLEEACRMGHSIDTHFIIRSKYWTYPLTLDDFLATVAGWQRSEDKSKMNVVRLYQNESDKHERISQVMAALASAEREPDLQWKQLFPEAGWCLILNKMERYNLELCSKLAPVVNIIRQNNHYAFTDFELTFFAGNYEYTPFGIHTDKLATSLHVVLGPNAKTMYTWFPHQYLPLLREQENHDLQKCIAHGIKTTLTTGDAYLFAADRLYHLGFNHGFSTSFALGVNKYNQIDLHEKLFSDDPDWNFELTKNIQLNTILEPVGEGIYKLSALAEADKSSKYVLQLAEFSLAKRSNCYYKTHAAKGTLDGIHPNTLIGQIDIFPVLALQHREQLHIFVRGHKISLPAYPVVQALLGAINKQPFTLQEIGSEFEGQLTAEFIHSLIVEIINLGGLKQVPEA